MKRLFRYDIILIVVTAILSRLPLLLSDNLFMDGDECIMGLMAKHFYEGREFPLFFYGQSYGFSLFEILPVSLFYSIFGVSLTAVKLAMLGLWIAGLVFFYKAMLQMGEAKHKREALMITLLFIFLPSYSLWSMKARGGYLTAFFLSSFVLYLLFHPKWKKSVATAFITGLLLSLIFQSQALWLAGLLPFLIYVLYRQKVRYIMALSAGTAGGIIIFHFLKTHLSAYWSPVIWKSPDLSSDNLISLLKTLYTHMLGTYNYSSMLTPVWVTQALAVVFIFFIFFTLMAGIYFLITGKKLKPLFYVACTSVLLSMGYMFFIMADFRYLLPLTGYALLMIYLFLINIKPKKTVDILWVAMILAGLISNYHFKNYTFNNMRAKQKLINDLKAQNIKYVYSEDGLLQWEIMFHTNEEIIARSKPETDRYPRYVRLVDQALKTEKSKTALVGYDKKGYYIIKNPSKSLLREHGFQFAREN